MAASRAVSRLASRSTLLVRGGPPPARVRRRPVHRLPAPASAPSASAPIASDPSSTGQAAFADVPMYRMDPTHQDVQPGPGPDGQPQLIWSVKAGGAMTSPILGDGTLFVGSDDGYLYAFDARTGADRWRLDLGAPIQRARVRQRGRGGGRPERGPSRRRGGDRCRALAHGAHRQQHAAPVLAGGIVYITGTDHKPTASISRPASNGGRGRPRPI